MFENFVIFTEVVKLSQNVFYNLRNVNYSDGIFEALFIRKDIEAAESLVELIQDKIKVINVARIFEDSKDNNKRWMNLISQLVISSNLKVSTISVGFLFECCKFGCIELIEYAIENGSQFHKDYYAPLAGASWNGHLEIVKYLIENGTNCNDIKFEAFAAAANKNQMEIIRYFFSEGIIKDFYNECLIFAAKKGYLEIVKYLVENSTDSSQFYFEALNVAKEHKQDHIIDYLELIMKRSINDVQ